jgi:hypothetical protein
VPAIKNNLGVGDTEVDLSYSMSHVLWTCEGGGHHKPILGMGWGIKGPGLSQKLT